MRLSKLLKFYRTANDLSQTELCEILGLSPNYLSLLENEKQTAGLNLLKKIAVKLNFSEGGLMFLCCDIPTELNGTADAQVFHKLQQKLFYEFIE